MISEFKRQSIINDISRKNTLVKSRYDIRDRLKEEISIHKKRVRLLNEIDENISKEIRKYSQREIAKKYSVGNGTVTNVFMADMK